MQRQYKSSLPNGLTVVSERLPSSNSVSIGVWLRTGARVEKLQELGICHFIEHMLFKGTSNRTALEIAGQVEQVGGEFNAFTSREHTCFHILLLKDDFGLGSELLVDILLHSTFDTVEVDRERKVILQEIMMEGESPEDLAFDLLFEKIFPRHSLGRPILGTPKTVRAFRRSDLIRFFKTHYRPENLVIAVAGDVSHHQVVKTFEPLGRRRDWIKAGFSLRTVPKRDEALQKAPKFRPGSWWLDHATEQVHVVLAVEGFRFNAKDRFAAMLLNTHLGGGMSSVLFQEVREKNGLAYSVYSHISPFLDTGVFSVYAAIAPQDTEICLHIIEESLLRLTQQELSERELNLLKSNLKGTILLNSDSAECRMMTLAKNEIYFGRAIPLHQVSEWIDQVTPEDIKRVARRLFKRNPRGLLAVGPRPKRAQQKRLEHWFNRSSFSAK